MAKVELDSTELDWRQYKLLIDLYRFYALALLRVNAFHYAVTGAILSYCLSHGLYSPIRWSLALPVAYSFGLAVICWIAKPKVAVLGTAVADLARNKLRQAAPNVDALGHLLTLFGFVHIITSVVLGAVMLFPGLIATPSP